MLILSRKAGEKVVIGGNIKVTVVDIVGHRVRLGIEADRSTLVLREELLDRVPDDQATIWGKMPVGGDR